MAGAEDELDWGQAGIGGGYRGNGGIVTIAGGTVHAEAGFNGAGIGSGFATDVRIIDINGGTVAISGGDVTATGSTYTLVDTYAGAGIGGGTQRAGGSLSVTGGMVMASAGNAEAQGIGRGSNLTHEALSPGRLLIGEGYRLVGSDAQMGSQPGTELSRQTDSYTGDHYQYMAVDRISA